MKNRVRIVFLSILITVSMLFAVSCGGDKPVDETSGEDVLASGDMSEDTMEKTTEITTAQEDISQKQEEDELKDVASLVTPAVGNEEEKASDVQDETDDTIPEYPLRIINDQVIIGRSGWLFYAGKDSMENYTGANALSESELSALSLSLERLKGTCDSKGKIFRVLICPEKETIYPEYYPAVEIVSKKRPAELVCGYVTEHTDVPMIYPLKDLKEAKRYATLYYEHDSHWNNAGAYVAARKLLMDIDQGTVISPIEDLPLQRIEPVSGDLIILGNINPGEYGPDVDYNIVYKPQIGITSDPEQVGSELIEEYRSDSDNDLSIVLIGDSFNIKMIQYICKDYTRCSYVHKTLIQDERGHELIRNADVIVFETVERNLRLMADDADRISDCLLGGE